MAWTSAAFSVSALKGHRQAPPHPLLGPFIRSEAQGWSGPAAPKVTCLSSTPSRPDPGELGRKGGGRTHRRPGGAGRGAHWAHGLGQGLWRLTCRGLASSEAGAGRWGVGQAGQPRPLLSAGGLLGPAGPGLGCDARLAALPGAWPPRPSGALGRLPSQV